MKTNESQSEIEYLADYNNEVVKNKALELTGNHETVQDKVKAIFYYVRDGIKFQFPEEGDFVRASQTIKYGYGQCNTKTTLFIALCKATGIEARVHFSLIDKEIQRGIITGLFYWLIPDKLSHDWVEVRIDDKWVRIDSYINDQEFYEKAKKKLQEKSWDTGFSVASSKHESSMELDFENEQFVQMDAVTEDHGVYDEPMEYYRSSKYQNRPNALTLFIYKMLVKGINNKVREIRYS